MKKLLLIATILSGFYVHAQEKKELPVSLQMAVKQNWDENELKLNIPDNVLKKEKLITINESTTEIKEDMTGNFYDVFADGDQDLYYRKGDPTHTTMPPPGPDFNYWYLPWQ